MEWLDRHFRVTERGSTIGTEIRAGLTTFMTMAYILVVNPTILSSTGLPFKQVAFATAATGAVGSGFVGLFGNLPFGLAPGMGLNAYFAYGVCLAKGVKAGTALCVVFLMGVSFGILSAAGACAYLQRAMPNNLKHAITVAIGLFQAFLGFRMINVVVGNPHTLVALGDLTSHDVLLGLGTTLVIGVLIVHRVPGAMLLGIGASSCVSWACRLAPLPESLLETPMAKSMWSELRWAEVASEWQELLPVLLALLFVCIFDTAGVQFGAGMQAGLLDAHGQLPGTKAAFLGSSLATAVGAVLGTSPTIIHNETCAGIADGGRTGLTALVVALLFGASVFFVPVFAAVPLTATAPALIVVGAFMMGPAGAMDWDNFRSSLPAFMTITIMPLTYSIANGVVAGLVTHAALHVCSTDPRAWLPPAARAPPASTAKKGTLGEPLNGSSNGFGHGNGHSNGSGSNGLLEPENASAAFSPHAMVRDSSQTSRGSFNGLAALAGGSSCSTSPQPSPPPPTMPNGKYSAPSLYPNPTV